MPVNVAFGPSAGLVGQMAFGVGKRKYSDVKDEVEYQSRREMLSDAMQFTRLLQDTRRPEEEHQRGLERMKKQQEIAQDNVEHSENVRRAGVEWETKRKREQHTAQVEALELENQKIKQKADEMRQSGMPENDVRIWENRQYGMARSKAFQTPPPPAMNPVDRLVTIGDRVYTPLANGDYKDITAERNREKHLAEANELKKIELAVRQNDDMEKRVYEHANSQRKELAELRKITEERYSVYKEDEEERDKDGTITSRAWGQGHPKYDQYVNEMQDIHREFIRVEEWLEDELETGASKIWAPLLGVSGGRAESVLGHIKERAGRADRRRKGRDLHTSFRSGDVSTIRTSLEEMDPDISKEELRGVADIENHLGGVPFKSITGHSVDRGMFEHVVKNPTGVVARKAFENRLLTSAEVGEEIKHRDESRIVTVSAGGKKYEVRNKDASRVKGAAKDVEGWNNIEAEIKNSPLPPGVKKSLGEMARKAKKYQEDRLAAFERNGTDMWQEASSSGSPAHKYVDAREKFEAAWAEMQGSMSDGELDISKTPDYKRMIGEFHAAGRVRTKTPPLAVQGWAYSGVPQ